jgi:SAM-dependent methyltransferase
MTTDRKRLLERLRSRLLRFLFQVMYGPGAQFYDPFTRIAFAGEWRRWQLTALRALPVDGVVVELGCGTGDFAAIAAEAFDAWIGLDISQEMISVAKHHNCPPTPMFVRASAAEMPLRNELADGIVATFPTSAIFELGVAAEIRRVLKPDGKLVVVLGGDLNPVGIRRRCVRVVTEVLQGGATSDESWVPAFAGFVGRTQWQATEFGRALIYVGAPTTTPGDGCIPPTGDVAWRAPRRQRD